MSKAKAKKKHSALLWPNSNGGASMQAMACSIVAIKTVMTNRFMANAAATNDQAHRRGRSVAFESQTAGARVRWSALVKPPSV